MAATDEYENQLPVQNTGKHIRALDANGNPILIPIDEMAKVVGGLIGTATDEKEGLLSRNQLINNMQSRGFSNGIIHKIANISRLYQGIMITGIETVYGDTSHIFIYRNVSGIHAKGNAFSGLSLKIDSNSNIYISVVTGRSFCTRIEALGSDNIIPIAIVEAFPSGAEDIPFT